MNTQLEAMLILLLCLLVCEIYNNLISTQIDSATWKASRLKAKTCENGYRLDRLVKFSQNDDSLPCYHVGKMVVPKRNSSLPTDRSIFNLGRELIGVKEDRQRFKLLRQSWHISCGPFVRLFLIFWREILRTVRGSNKADQVYGSLG